MPFTVPFHFFLPLKSILAFFISIYHFMNFYLFFRHLPSPFSRISSAPSNHSFFDLALPLNPFTLLICFVNPPSLIHSLQISKPPQLTSFILVTHFVFNPHSFNTSSFSTPSLLILSRRLSTPFPWHSIYF